MMIQCYETGTLHNTAREGILNLIPKANKDTRYIKNLRPITLLNTDYKIIEKAIANKMIPALKHIINKDQRGFMKDRRISVNIRMMLDIMHKAEKEDIEAIIMSLDFVKCFDKCSFSILHGSLEYFNFGKIIREWTEILYKDFSVKIQNNGHFSKLIEIKKGVHQGGCCSSIYFLVIAEILAISLRSNTDIDGITLQDIKNLLNQFADDMDVFSLANEKSIRAIHGELERFRYQSGFTVSYEKTTLYRIGSLKHSDAEMYSISDYKWTNQDISVLGVTIAHDDILQKNYHSITKKVSNTLNAWNNRGLSLIGKVQVVNTLIASLFVYKMMVLPIIPKHTVKSVENIIREFLWSGGKSKIAYRILQNPKDQGGLNLVDLIRKDKALKATWPQILAEEKEYSELVYKIMRCTAIKEEIWNCSLAPEDVQEMKINNNFWKDVLYSWSEYNYYHNRRTENQCIWYNSKIRIENKPFLWCDIYKKGLIFVHQLFENQRFITHQQAKEHFGLGQMRYNSLLQAIPGEWKTFFKENPKTSYTPIPPHNYQQVVALKQQNLSKIIYQYTAEDVFITQNKYTGWQKELGEPICDNIVDFGRKHLDLYKVTNIAKYRSFQYRLLQRGLVTNIQLMKWKIKPSDLCSLCGNEPETIPHLLWECMQVKDLWQQIFKLLKTEYGQENLVVNTKAIMLNEITSKKGSIANLICLLAKHYIYSQKCLGKSITFPAFRMHLKHIESMEKYIAIKNNKLDKHNKKWVCSAQIISDPQDVIQMYFENR